MKFQIFLHPKAARFLDKVDKEVRSRIKDKIKVLKQHPEIGKRLNYSDFWSLRIGDYRVVYEISKKEKQVIILFIGHRKNVYDDFIRMF
jgi:mRNA interferase RelE/StbE